MLVVCVEDVYEASRGMIFCSPKRTLYFVDLAPRGHDFMVDMR